MTANSATSTWPPGTNRGKTSHNQPLGDRRSNTPVPRGATRSLLSPCRDSNGNGRPRPGSQREPMGDVRPNHVGVETPLARVSLRNEVTVAALALVIERTSAAAFAAIVYVTSADVRAPAVTARHNLKGCIWAYVPALTAIELVEPSVDAEPIAARLFVKTLSAAGSAICRVVKHLDAV
jgi:hypothetical protein